MNINIKLKKITFFLSIIMISGVIILALTSCNGKQINPIDVMQSNPLNGKWKSNDAILKMLNPGLEPTQLEFNENILIVNGETRPIIYKIKKDRIIIFSRGERLVAHLVAEDRIVLFLNGIGKKIYIKLK